MATRKDFQSALEEVFREYESEGKAWVDVEARDLHRRVGGYPGPGHTMPTCCRVMRQNMQRGDEILHEPPKGKGASLRIRYKLPRLQASQGWRDTLIVVSCTSKKIWDEDASANPYVPAKHAYVGRTVKDWLGKCQPKLDNYPWVILSAKYGFIEPDHPIGNYDVTFRKAGSGPISDASLRNQVLHQPRFLGSQEMLLRDFKCVAVKGPSAYLEKAKLAFTATGAEVVSFREFCRRLTAQNAP